jgi:hypothetical protein
MGRSPKVPNWNGGIGPALVPKMYHVTVDWRKIAMSILPSAS